MDIAQSDQHSTASTFHQGLGGNLAIALSGGDTWIITLKSGGPNTIPSPPLLVQFREKGIILFSNPVSFLIKGSALSRKIHDY